jgi:putative restriction endonuclease
VLLAYEGRCAVCGWDGNLGGDAVGVEAAHIRWFTIDGPDTLDNGLCLCSLHHRLLDSGAIGITGELTLAVSLHFVAHGPTARRLVYDLIDKPLEAPQAGQVAPSPDHVDWHGREVFRGPARRSA